MIRRNTKTFDCVEFKQNAQEEIYEQISGLSAEEEIAFFERAAANGPFGHFWNELREKPRGEPTASIVPPQ